MSHSKAVYYKWLEQTKVSASNSSVLTYYFELAGIKLAIRLHRIGLEKPFLSAISHLEVGACAPDYQIDVWDSYGNDASFPRFDHTIEDVKTRGEVPKYSLNGLNFAYYAHARMVHILNENERHGIVALNSDPDHLPKFELACPFRGIFSWILRNNHMAMIHCAALANHVDDVYLIAGRSGAGKSTTAISCLLEGMRYLGDDLCAIGRKHSEIRIYSIYSSGKTFRSEWAYLPQLSHLAAPYADKDFDKEIYFFGEIRDATSRGGRLKTVYVPVKGNEPFSTPSIASLISTTIESTRTLLPDAGFESLPLLCAAFKQANIIPLALNNDRRCPIRI